MFIDKNNRFSILYISDSEEEEKEKPIIKKVKEKKIINCEKNYNKKFCRKSYKKNIIDYDDYIINKKFLELQKYINNLVYNNKTNDKSLNIKNKFINHKKVNLGHISNSSIF